VWLSSAWREPWKNVPSQVAYSGSKLVNDGCGAWCAARTSCSVAMTVDGVVTGGNHNHPAGSTPGPDHRRQGNCDQVNTSCDNFVGDIDDAKVQTS